MSIILKQKNPPTIWGYFTGYVLPKTDVYDNNEYDDYEEYDDGEEYDDDDENDGDDEEEEDRWVCYKKTL